MLSVRARCALASSSTLVVLCVFGARRECARGGPRVCATAVRRGMICLRRATDNCGRAAGGTYTFLKPFDVVVLVDNSPDATLSDHSTQIDHARHLSSRLEPRRFLILLLGISRSRLIIVFTVLGYLATRVPTRHAVVRFRQ